MIGNNVLLITDSYKVSHYRQYPKGTKQVYSYFESRGGRWNETVFFGLQYLMKRYLEGRVITQDKIEEAEQYYAAHFNDPTLFNTLGWRQLLAEYGGHLPVCITAVPEGSVIPTSNVLFSIYNTADSYPWLTNWLETLLVQLWYPCTVATQSREMRKVVKNALHRTGDVSLLDFKVHDFGYRGSTSVESAGIGGAAHLLSFAGTDTIAALEVARQYYQEPMAGFSIPAAEHSTITSWGRENEVLAFQNMLEQFPTGLVAVVSDSYDIYSACKELWGQQLKNQVLARDGVLVVRPDSGDPRQVVPELLEILGQAFGYTVNAKGFRVLNDKVRMIQGDGIDLDMLGSVLQELESHAWSADNLAFGSGGGLLQKMNRDTQKFAMKCSAIRINDTWHDVSKSPVGDPTKRSKAGRLALVKYPDGFRTINKDQATDDVMRTVFMNGQILQTDTFAEIRYRARQ